MKISPEVEAFLSWADIEIRYQEQADGFFHYVVSSTGKTSVSAETVEEALQKAYESWLDRTDIEDFYKIAASIKTEYDDPADKKVFVSTTPMCPGKKFRAHTPAASITATIRYILTNKTKTPLS